MQQLERVLGAYPHVWLYEINRVECPGQVITRSDNGREVSGATGELEGQFKIQGRFAEEKGDLHRHSQEKALQARPGVLCVSSPEHYLTFSLVRE